MNARNRAEQCNLRPDLHDALLPRERQILGMWDEGWSCENIAELLGLKLVTVKCVTVLFDDRDDGSEAEMMRRGSQLLRARILQFHPHVALGCEK